MRRRLPQDSCYVQVDPLRQGINGRVPGLFEVLVYQRVSEGVVRGATIDEVLGPIPGWIADHAAHGDELAWWRGWLVFRDSQPLATSCLHAIEGEIERYYNLQPREITSQPFLVGQPR